MGRLAVLGLAVLFLVGCGADSEEQPVDAAPSSVATTPTEGYRPGTISPTTMVVTSTSAVPATQTSPVETPTDPLFDPSLWIGEVFEGVPPDYSIIHVDRTPTGLKRWAGGCITVDCEYQYELVAYDGELLEGGYPLMIWVSKVRESSDMTADQSESFIIVDAVYVDVPSGQHQGFECGIEASRESKKVVALVHASDPLKPTRAWSVEIGAIQALEPELVTCSVTD